MAGGFDSGYDSGFGNDTPGGTVFPIGEVLTSNRRPFLGKKRKDLLSTVTFRGSIGFPVPPSPGSNVAENELFFYRNRRRNR